MLDKVHRIFSNIRICAHRSLCNRNKRHHQVHHQHCSFKLIVNVLVEHNPVRKSTSSPNSRSISFFLADAYSTMPRSPSPGKSVEFFVDDQQKPKRSLSPGSGIADIIERPEHEKVSLLQSEISLSLSIILG